MRAIVDVKHVQVFKLLTGTKVPESTPTREPVLKPVNRKTENRNINTELRCIFY